MLLLSSFHHLHGDVQVHHKVFGRGGSEQEVEIASRQRQAPGAAAAAATSGHQDVVAGGNRTLDPEHGALQRLVLEVAVGGQEINSVAS